MSRDWKPGDVALVQNEYGVWNRAILQVHPDGMRWVYGVSYSSVSEASPSLPLVVINPEDRDEVRILANRFRQHDGGFRHDWEAMQAALRSSIAPPKPDEPTGKWAVVEDAKGWQWIRAFSGDEGEGAWLQDGCLTAGKWTDYSQINVRRVVSEGVTP